MPCETTSVRTRREYNAMSQEFRDIGFGENFLIVETLKKRYDRHPQARIYPIPDIRIPLKVAKFRGEKSADTELQSY